MIKDKYELTNFTKVKMPKFKGHIKITLHNCRTGKNEVYEGENIVTNAVRDILGANYLGAVDYSKIFPLWSRWYGGVLLYQNPHPTVEVGGEQVLNPDNYYPQADNVNHLVAHAGGTTIDASHDDDLRRGNPTSAAFVYTENSIKQVWEWGTTHGNGTISALSLTHKDTGDAGLGSNTYAFQNFSPLEQIHISSLGIYTTTGKSLINEQTIFERYDDNHGFYFTIGADGEYGINNGQNVIFSTNKITVYIKKFPYAKAGLYEVWTPNSDFVSKFTVTSSNITFYVNPSYYFDYENKRLWLFSNATSTSAFSSSVVNYIVIDCESKTEVAHGTITSDTSNLAPLGYTVNAGAYEYSWMVFTTNIIKNGNYFFFPTTSGTSGVYMRVTGYKKINYVSQSDQTTISFNDRQDIYTQPIYGGDLLISLGMTGKYPTTGRVVNGTVGYTCANGGISTGATLMKYSTPYAPSSYCVDTLGQNNSAAGARYIFANKMLNTTLYNLSTPIQKSGSQAMTVEYTLTETSGEEEE